MKWITIMGLLFITALLSCKSREREKQLAVKELELNEKEQQLLLKEKTLEFRQQELDNRLRIADSIDAKDSTLTDSVSAKKRAGVNAALAGDWSVRMTCIETSCTGSAVGDTKVEQWNLSYSGDHLVAKATDHGNLVRTYSGIYRVNSIELIEHRDTSMVYDTRMVVRIRQVNENKLEGQREIIRENDCKIVYALDMDKIK